MQLPPFAFHEPTSLDEALRMKASFGTRARLLAGGTDLIVNMKHGAVSPAHLISLARIDAMRHHGAENGCYRIGAGVTVAELLESAPVRQVLAALSQGAANLGTPLIRNLATIGGNLGSARPAADLPPSLMVYGARVVLKSASAEREVSTDDFFAGPGLTHIAPDEILTQIVVNTPPEGSGAGYINIGIRKAQDCNLVNVAAYLALDDDGRTIASARIAMGCVGPTHLRAPSAEAILTGETADPALFDRAADAAMQVCSPIDDFRGSAAYKRAMVGVLTRRTLAMALEAARDRS